MAVSELDSRGREERDIMQFSISLSSSHPSDGPRIMIERARAAHAAGFASLTIGDHHNMKVPYVQNTPMLGRLIAEWPDRQAGCLFIVPFWPALLMAEHIGTLASMTHGRFIVQTGIGTDPGQFAATGVRTFERAKQIEESINVVKRLLEGEVVSSERLGMRSARVGLLPPEPVEWWIGGTVEAGIKRAADMGDAWYASPATSVESGRSRLERYREYGGKRAIVRKDALILEDAERARAIATTMIEEGYRGFTREQLIIGNPADAAEQAYEYEEIGFDEIAIRCMSNDRNLALETIHMSSEMISAYDRR